MRSNISLLARCLAWGLGLGLLLWSTGCQQGQARQPGATGGSKGLPPAGQESKEEPMRDNGTHDDAGAGSSAGAVAPAPLAEDGAVTGAQNYTELASLDISISNGTLTVQRGAAPGEVRLSWTIKPGHGVRQAKPQDVVITRSAKGGLLAVADDYQGPKGLGSPEIDMVATVGENIAAAASLGNGTLSLNCARIKAADCGNGTLTLTGGLIDDADASLGNGTLKAKLLITGGSHELSVGNGQVLFTPQTGSSFKFTADTGVGSVTVGGPGVLETARDWDMVGGEVRGVAGAGADGAGELSISIGSGTISVVGEQAAAQPAAG
jgi:hypothetical protein